MKPFAGVDRDDAVFGSVDDQHRTRDSLGLVSSRCLEYDRTGILQQLANAGQIGCLDCKTMEHRRIGL